RCAARRRRWERAVVDAVSGVAAVIDRTSRRLVSIVDRPTAVAARITDRRRVSARVGLGAVKRFPPRKRANVLLGSFIAHDCRVVPERERGWIDGIVET